MSLYSAMYCASSYCTWYARRELSVGENNACLVCLTALDSNELHHSCIAESDAWQQADGQQMTWTTLANLLACHVQT